LCRLQGCPHDRSQQLLLRFKGQSFIAHAVDTLVASKVDENYRCPWA
jgi:hypothetical protein